MVQESLVSEIANIVGNGFRIRGWDRPDRLIIELTGVWTREDFAGYDRALRAALAQCPPQGHDLLIDLSAFGIQPAELVPLFRAQMEDGRGLTRRTALVVPTIIRRVQIMPLMNVRPNVRLFDSRSEAAQWLDADSSTDLTGFAGN